MRNALTAFFTDFLPTLETTYQWPKRIPINKPDAPWQFKTNGATECIELKQYLTQEWKKADTVQKTRLAHWIVKDWGGVRANAGGRIEAYLERIIANDIPSDIAGVASFSKILSVVDCTHYAIYDARVAAGLNAVQLLYPTDQPRYFPHVPSRNATIRQFVTWFANRPQPDKWTPVSRATAYAEYCQFLHSLKKTFTDREIYHFEMMLFSAAPCLCKRVMEKAT